MATLTKPTLTKEQRRLIRAARDPKNETRRRDLQVAMATIGDTPIDRLAWLVGFIAEAPMMWHSAERAARGDCLLVLVRPIAPFLHAPLLAPLSGPEVDTIHGELKRAFTQLVTGDSGTSTIFVTGGVTTWLVRASGVGQKPAIWSVTHGYKTARDGVFARALDLVLQAGDRLLACRHCTRPFLALHKRKFCSTECAQDWHNDKKPRKRG